MYKVIEKFADAKDYQHVYEVGDIYPREGRIESPERIEELSTTKNRLKIPLIQEVKEAKKPEKAEEVSEEEKPAKKRTKKVEE